LFIPTTCIYIHYYVMSQHFLLHSPSSGSTLWPTTKYTSLRTQHFKKEDINIDMDVCKLNTNRTTRKENMYSV